MILLWVKRCNYSKINRKLSERVVAVLEKMKCPTRIFPHQIQGLDYENIFPVLKYWFAIYRWLVKILYESRDIKSDVNRNLAEYTYDLSYKTKSQLQPDPEINPNKLQQKLTGPRLFKRKNIYDIQLRDPKRIYSTLFEFNDPISKEYYRNLIEAYDNQGGPKKQMDTGKSMFIGKSGGANFAGQGDDSALGGKVGMSKDGNDKTHQKSTEAISKLEGEVEKISENEGLVKGDNIGGLIMQNIQNITDNVDE